MFWIAKAAFTEIHLFRAIFSCIREQFIHITFLSLTFLVSRYRRGGISNIKMQNSITELYMCVYMRERKRRSKKMMRDIYPYTIYISIYGGAYCRLQVNEWYGIALINCYNLASNTIPSTQIPPSACSQSHMCCQKHARHTCASTFVLPVHSAKNAVYCPLPWLIPIPLQGRYICHCRKFSSAILLSLLKIFLLLMAFPLDCQTCVSTMQNLSSFCSSALLIFFLLFSLLFICRIGSGIIRGYFRRSCQMDIWARWGWLGSRMGI